jgi:hypothetical protein
MFRLEENLIYNSMKNKIIRLMFSFIVVIVASCDEPETVVTDIVHTDGSITRKIDMKNYENKFKVSELQVPFDNTWTIKDTVEINEKGDTTWIKSAEKLFKNAMEINLSYRSDSGANKHFKRSVVFKRRFKWFNTEYRFAEIVDKRFSYGYPASDFLNQEELAYFYSPDDVKSKQEEGPDSLKYKALKDTVSKKQDIWVTKSVVSEWINDFEKLAKDKSNGDTLFNSLKQREDELVKLINQNDSKFDSLWENGILLKEIVGEPDAVKYKIEADSAMSMVTDILFADFKSYSVKIIMPGEVIGTNGILDSSKTLLWPVNSDYFLTEPYTMFAESRIPNRWTWIISGVFLLFVVAGMVFRKIKKG